MGSRKHFPLDFVPIEHFVRFAIVPQKVEKFETAQLEVAVALVRKVHFEVDFRPFELLTLRLMMAQD